MLTAAGWVAKDKRRLNLHAGLGIALCETDVEGGFADYIRELARQRFHDWLTHQETAAGKPFTAEQRTFLAHIADEIGANAALETDGLLGSGIRSPGKART